MTAASQPAPHFIDRKQLLHWSAEAMRRSPDPEAGLFGPDSMMWRVGREAITFMGAGRAALLQLAHPWVATAIDQHSATRVDPAGRFHRTFINVFTMVYGNLAQVERVVRRVHHIHTAMQGQLTEDAGAFAAGSHYQANEAHAMLWVHATLWDTAWRMHRTYIGELSAAETEQYYRETKLFAWLFGIPDHLIPPDWAAFQHWCGQMVDSPVLTVGDTGRAMGEMIFRFPTPVGQWPLRWFQRLTAASLPPRLREGFDLPAPDAQWVARTERRVRRLYHLLPATARYIPPYQEALRRIAGRAPSPATRAMSRLWLGRPALVARGVLP